MYVCKPYIKSNNSELDWVFGGALRLKMGDKTRFFPSQESLGRRVRFFFLSLVRRWFVLVGNQFHLCDRMYIILSHKINVFVLCANKKKKPLRFSERIGVKKIFLNAKNRTNFMCVFVCYVCESLVKKWLQEENWKKEMMR